MRAYDRLKIERRLLEQFDGLPLQARILLCKTYDDQIKSAKEDNTDGAGDELLFLMEDILNEYKDTETGG